MSIKSKSIMPPPWLAFRHIEMYSLDWLMGYSEDYMFRFGDWFDELSQEELNEYRELFPEPITWSGWYEEDGEPAFLEHGKFRICAWQDQGKPKYDLQWLQREFASKKRHNMCFFWGHTGPKDEITKACLSQWYPQEFCFSVAHYNCMEQFMMANKAELFGDMETKDKIMQCSTPKQAKAFGRMVKDFDQEIWDKFKHSIVVNGNWCKFSQNRALCDFLLATGDSILVEASPVDKIWGIGLAADNPDAQDPLKWKGQNMLGFALMEVRDELQKVNRNESLCDFDCVIEQ